MAATTLTQVSPGTGTAGRPWRHRRAGGAGMAPYVFLVPWFLGLAVFTVGPLLYSLYLSFTDDNLLQSPTWVGLANYRKMFTDDPRYLHSVKITLIYVLISVPLKLVIAFLVALLLNRPRRGIGLYRSLFYLPSLLGASVAVALVWRSMFSQSGSVDGALGLVGVHGQDWINNPTWALGTIIVLACWQFGAPMVIFLAGLKQVPGELYDAASADGAGRWARWWHVTLPMLSPIIFFNVLLETVNAFQAFTPAFIVSGGTGGPADSTLFYTLYLYQEGFSSFRFGYASAMAWVLLATVAIVTALMFWASRAVVFYADEGEH
ncbi:carbohydrate ABC transporter permease [Rugosimonospora africana]|uniref:Sugar ABC transporter permease n=1 Tax=Rugosimonospora africana TaxID=556532 RepID=A0A8J3QXR1_9ACTN|nr:sugar ABC transporter permease [Rugosimonospora africana]GIH18798.1 sugar ABC transporter permease [Rugosimonospora africana]